MFVGLLFKKVLIGRNVNIKANDLKQLVKFSMNNFGPFYFMDKLVPYLLSKEKGGARTTHQVNGVFSILGYIIDSAQNKLKDPEMSEFKEQFFSFENKEILALQKKSLDVLSENLMSEEKVSEEKETSSNSSNPALKNSHFFLGFINFFDKFSSFMKNSKLNFAENEEMNKTYKNISTILEKIVGQYELKNVQKKVAEISEKFC